MLFPLITVYPTKFPIVLAKTEDGLNSRCCDRAHYPLHHAEHPTIDSFTENIVGLHFNKFADRDDAGPFVYKNSYTLYFRQRDRHIHLHIIIKLNFD